MGRPKLRDRSNDKLKTAGVVVLFLLVGGSLILQSRAATLDGDINNDGTVNLTDLSMLLSHWGNTSTTPPPAPPPTNLVACSATPTSGTAVSASSLSSAVSGASGGQTFMVSGSGSLSISGKNFASPVVIKAATLGAATLSTVQITNSSGIVLEGFKFGPNSNSTYLKIASSTNIRIMRNIFDHKDVSTNQTAIITSGTSQNIDIGCNEFRDKNVSGSGGTKISGSFIKTQYDAPNMTKNLHVYRNYFHNITPYVPAGATEPAGDSDREAIVMGDADAQDIATSNIVEYNLFEDCDGENEVISVKTSNNTFRYNTFKNSMGSLTFRLGHNSEASNNYFYGVGAGASPSDPNYQTGGMRIYGTGHILRNNYMKDLTGMSWRLPILLDSGDTSDSTGGDSHELASAATVSGNTILNSVGGGIHVGSSNYGNQPKTNTISGNTVAASQNMLYEDRGTSGSWSGNKAYPSGSATAVGGSSKTSAEVQVLTGTPGITDPGALTTSSVGPNLP